MVEHTTENRGVVGSIPTLAMVDLAAPRLEPGGVLLAQLTDWFGALDQLAQQAAPWRAGAQDRCGLEEEPFHRRSSSASGGSVICFNWAM